MKVFLRFEETTVAGRKHNPIHWLWNSPRAQIALGVLLLLGVAGWLAPRPIEQIVTVGERESWTSNAPSIREIVWETPGQLEEFRADDTARLVTPHLTDHGATLYFSRRVEGGQTDIFVTRLVDGLWQKARAVSQLNSAGDDLGPVIAADGSELYFYSNRPGGLGGTDLYVAHRTPAGWSAPENGGPAINSTGNEYDPALSPDGRSIYFASNRSDNPLPEQRVAEDGAPAWNTTLRAQNNRVTFDLYRAARKTAESAWGEAAPLSTVNQTGASQGAPFVSPDGAFLYFASDRVVRSGEERNLDLFRAPLTDGSPGDPVNLGAGVNSVADETEPALSPEGFTLVFSSNREGTDRLYSSRAREIVRTTGWDTSHVPAFQNAWVLVPALLFAALMALLYWQRRQVVERLWPARFFLGSVVINFLLLFLLAVWKFPEVLEVVTNVFEESVPAPEMLDENAHQSHEDGREAYEKVADLKSVDAESIPEVVRQVNEVSSVPERTERLTQTISAAEARALPPERVVFITPDPPPEPAPQPKSDSPLERRRPARPVEMAALTDLPDVELPEEPLPEEPAPQKPTEATVAPAEQPMTKPVPDRAAAAETPDPARPDATPLRPAEVAETAVDTPPANATSNPFQRRPRTRTVTVAAAESKLPDLPDGETAVPAELLAQAEAAVERAAATDNSNQPMPVLDAAKSGRPDARPAQATPNRTPVRTADLPTTRPADLANPFQNRKRKSPVVTAVATLDSSLPDVSAAAEIPAEKTVEATRPDFQRSSAATTPLKSGQPAPAAGESAPATRPSRIAPAATATKPVEDALTVAAATLPQEIPRSRPGRQTEPVLVAAVDVDAEQLAGAEVAATGPALESATATVDRKAADPGEAATSTAQARTATKPVPEITARSLKPMSRPPETLAVAVSGTPVDPLQRRRSTARPIVETNAATDATADVPMGDEVAASESVSASDAALERSDSSQLISEVATPRAISGSSTSVENRIIVGELAEKSNDAPPAFSPIASRLNRKRARAMKVALARDNVGLQALFTLRQGDTRKKHIELLGGSEATEKAVSLGLEWLAKNQLEDGSWDLRKHQGNTNSLTAATGLGVLPFLAAGYTHNMDGQYKEVVAKAVTRLLENQQDSGELLRKGDAQRMYSHGIAAIALCEAFAMSQDEALKGPAQKSLDFIVASQHKASGGWRYNPNEAADTSVVGWQMMALKSGEMAGLTVPTSSYDLVQKWLSSVEAKQGPGGTFGYQNRSATPAMTAEGLLCLQFMGTRRNDPKMRFGADYLLRSMPEKSQKLTSYYWYYATQTMYHMQGDYWDQWNERTKDVLITTQETSGNNAGSWGPRDNWEKSGGRIYATSLKLLMLEVYYRHLPLYDQLEF